MNDLSQQMLSKYRTSFLKEVEANVEQGQWVKMCTQCGVCAGSCPLGKHWDHPPQRIFMMIRAGEREQVLTSDSMWMCTSCYSCSARCPRGLPVTHIIHGLAHYAKRLNLVPQDQPTQQFSQIFWDNLMKQGRVNELQLSLSLYFKDGFADGIKHAIAHRKLGQGLIKARRMRAMEVFGGNCIKDPASLQKIIAKAQQIEDTKIRKPEE